MSKKRIGEILMEEGLIDEEDLSEALKYKEQSGYKLGSALVALRIIGEWQLTEALGKALDLPVVDLAADPPSPAALRKIPPRLSERFDLIPWKIERDGKTHRLLVAMSDPLNASVVRRMSAVAEMEIKPVLAGLSSIQRAIRQNYHDAEKSRVLERAERMTSEKRRVPERGAAETFGVDSMDDATLRGSAEERLEILELRHRALLHLLLKKQLLTEKDYAKVLKELVTSRRLSEK